FQAEDGIRDLTVTGVQTCALPISPTLRRGSWSSLLIDPSRLRERGYRPANCLRAATPGFPPAAAATTPPNWDRPLRETACRLSRSEERRVGKEARRQGLPCRSADR